MSFYLPLNVGSYIAVNNLNQILQIGTIYFTSFDCECSVNLLSVIVSLYLIFNRIRCCRINYMEGEDHICTTDFCTYIGCSKTALQLYCAVYINSKDISVIDSVI